MRTVVLAIAGLVASCSSGRPARSHAPAPQDAARDAADLQLADVVLVVVTVQTPAGPAKSLVARRPNVADRVIDTPQELAALIQHVNSVAGASALADFALVTLPKYCEVFGNGTPEPDLPAAVTASLKATPSRRTQTESGEFVIERYLICIDDPRPDRLILSHEEITRSGAYRFGEKTLVYAGRLLPRLQ